MAIKMRPNTLKMSIFLLLSASKYFFEQDSYPIGSKIKIQQIESQEIEIYKISFEWQHTKYEAINGAIFTSELLCM